MDKRNRLLFGVIAVVTLIICLLGFHLNQSFYHDDSFITLRYSYNFLNGDGIVWNPSERVEGYTNFLYLILISILGQFGIDLILASRIVNVIAFTCLIIFIYFYLNRYAFIKQEKPELTLSYIPLLMTLTSFPIIIWSLGGLEGPVFALFCTIGICLISESMDNNHRNRYLILGGLAFSLTAMTRLDGILFVITTILFLTYLALKRSDIGVKPLLSFVIAFCCVFVPYFLWRLVYYQQLLPNAFYVKVTGFDLGRLAVGLEYLMTYYVSPPFILPMLTLALLYLSIKYKNDKKKVYILSSILVYLIYVVYVGGDHMPVYRFIVPIIPASILLLYLALRPFLHVFSGMKAFMVYALILFHVGLQIFYDGTNARQMDWAALTGRIVGMYIATAWPDGSLVALNTAGSTPYFAPNHRYIDMLGLNDVQIARREIKTKQLHWQSVPGHAKGDGSYVLSRDPDYIIVGPAEGTSIDRPWFLSDLELSQSPQFFSDYEMQRVNMNIFIFTYYKKVTK